MLNFDLGSAFDEITEAAGRLMKATSPEVAIEMAAALIAEMEEKQKRE
jgi:hypothetical protein